MWFFKDFQHLQPAIQLVEKHRREREGASETDAGKKLREFFFGKIWAFSHNFFPVIFVYTVSHCFDGP